MHALLRAAPEPPRDHRPPFYLLVQEEDTAQTTMHVPAQ